MNMQKVDVSEIVDGISRMLSRFAVPHEAVPNTNEHNVRVMRGNTEAKQSCVLFQFMTLEQFIASIDVDMQEFMQEPEAYLDGLMHELTAKMNEARRDRQDATRIYIPGATGIEPLH